MAGKLKINWDLAIVAAIVFVGIIVLCTLPVKASDCRQFFYQKQAVAVVAYPQIYYQAGASIENDALAEKVARIVVQKLQAAPQLRQQQQATSSVLYRKCAQCHSGANPKGGILLDETAPIYPEQFVRIAGMLGEHIDVPSQMKRLVESLTPEEKGGIMSDMIRLSRHKPEQPADKSPPLPAPVGQLE